MALSGCSVLSGVVGIVGVLQCGCVVRVRNGVVVRARADLAKRETHEAECNGKREGSGSGSHRGLRKRRVRRRAQVADT